MRKSLKENAARKIRVAIAGIGNCASALVQGIEFYGKNTGVVASDLPHHQIGAYGVSDIEVAAAFDIDKRKVGKPVNEAIFAKPNCSYIFEKNLPAGSTIVQMAPLLDGVSDHMLQYREEQTFCISNAPPISVSQVLNEANVDVLVCFLPVGSQKGGEHYANACLETGVAFVNCAPVFIASNSEWARKFRASGLPIIGDDIKSQFGATMLHRILVRSLSDRGLKIDNTYQINTGGNTDFLNMLDSTRLQSKRISKTESVQSQLDSRLNGANIHIGPSDYVQWQNDNKVCFLRIEWRGFGNVPMNLEARLSVEDSPNSAGIVIDAVRCARLALDQKESGPLEVTSAYMMKHPPSQMRDDDAAKAFEQFLINNIPIG